MQNTARYSVALLLVLAAACTKKQPGMDTSSAAGAIAPDTSAAPMATATPPTPTPPGVILMTVSKPGRGMLLVDGTGRALYVLDHSPTDTNSWKPVSGATAPTTTDTAIKGSMIGTTTSPSGGMQATYSGKPLYYFAGDSAANDMKGEGKRESGATGHLIRPDGSEYGGKNGKMKH